MAFTKEDWWIVDSQGRRIGYLHPEDFAAILESFFGRRWVTKFAEEFGFSRSAVDRWKDGRTPIPKHIAAALSMMSSLKLRNIALQPVEAPWLPVRDDGDDVEEPADAGTN